MTIDIIESTVLFFYIVHVHGARNLLVNLEVEKAEKQGLRSSKISKVTF